MLDFFAIFLCPGYLFAAVGFQAIEALFVCFSYDIGLTRLRRHHNGSLEATVRWWFNPPDDVTPVKPARPF
jgi:hypothetical protein